MVRVCRGNEFIQLLEGVYDAQNMDLGDIEARQKQVVNPLRLRAIIDNVIEQLPPMLELGDVPGSVLGGTDYSFPYHRPSLQSFATIDDQQMPESIGFVLLQVQSLELFCLHEQTLLLWEIDTCCESSQSD